MGAQGPSQFPISGVQGFRHYGEYRWILSWVTQGRYSFSLPQLWGYQGLHRAWKLSFLGCKKLETIALMLEKLNSASLHIMKWRYIPHKHGPKGFWAWLPGERNGRPHSIFRDGLSTLLLLQSLLISSRQFVTWCLVRMSAPLRMILPVLVEYRVMKIEVVTQGPHPAKRQAKLEIWRDRMLVPFGSNLAILSLLLSHRLSLDGPPAFQRQWGTQGAVGQRPRTLQVDVAVWDT